MALAILEFKSIDNNLAKFRIDTGTNRYYYLKVGKAVGERSGWMQMVEEVSSKTSLATNEKSDALFNTAKEISIPARLFNREDCFVQLFTFKNNEGRSPTFSKVVKVPLALKIDLPAGDIYSLSTSRNSIQMTQVVNPHRNIPHVAAEEMFATQTSFADILSQIIKIAGPIVAGIVSGMENKNTASGTPGNNVNGTAKQEAPQVGMFNTILEALLNGIGQAANAPANAAPVANIPSVSLPKSLSLSYHGNGNRFLQEERQLAKPFIFGIDDALIAAVAGPLIANIAGPVLQMIPQMINAENQFKLQEGAQENKFVTDVLAEGNREALLKQFLQNQPQGTAAAPPVIDMNQVMKLLQQMPQPTGATNGATVPVSNPVTPPVSITKSFSLSRFSQVLSTNSILAFELAPAIAVNGKNQFVFNKQGRLVLKLKLQVTDPASAKMLQKAIVKFCFKDQKHKTVLEKLFKIKNVEPGKAVEFEFTPDETKGIPSHKPLNTYAEMKWLAASGQEIKALGATELLFARGYLLKEQGVSLPGEKEPVDMKQYRSFWNKLWESPVMDKMNARNDTVTKYRWELDAQLKFTVLLSAKHDSNGIMDTKMMFAKSDPEDSTQKFEGKMKAGIELSIAELNKLNALWGRSPLNEDQLAALNTRSLVRKNAADMIYSVRLKGMTKERGIVWVVPVLRQYNFTLSKIVRGDDYGQVTAVEEEKVQFPLPVAVRIIGLKTK